MGLVRDVSTSVGAGLMKARSPFARGLRAAPPHRLGAWVALLSLVLLAGCKSPMSNVSGYMRDKKLNDAVMDYNKYIRWQEWDKASAYLKTADQTAFKEKMEDAEETFRMTDFEIKDVTPADGARKALVRVFYRYYRLPSITERKLTVHQRWSWSEEERRWQIDTPFALPSRTAARTGAENRVPSAATAVLSPAVPRDADPGFDDAADHDDPTEN